MLAHALYSRRRWLTKIHPPEKKPSALGRGQVNHAEVLLRLVLHRRCPESKIDPSISLQKAILARSPPLCACMWRGLQRAFLAPFSSCFLSKCQEVRQKSLGMQNYDFINSRFSTYNVIHSVDSFHLVTVNQRIKIEFILNVIISNIDPNFKSVKSPLGNYDFIDSGLSKGFYNVIHSVNSFHVVNVNQRTIIECLTNVIISNLEPNFKSLESPLVAKNWKPWLHWFKAI